MKKGILIGNGFTSQIIPEYSSDVLIKKIFALIPIEMKKLESLFDPFRQVPLPPRPFVYDIAPDYWDEEDAYISYTPTYTKERFSPILRIGIEEVLEKQLGIKNPKKLCQRLFADAGLAYEMYRGSFLGIETPLKVIQIGLASSLITHEEANKVERAIKTVLFNEGNFHFPIDTNGCRAKVDFKKAKKYFESFSTVFTTNYDMLLDDMVKDKVKHLHGGFCFISPFKKDFKYNNPTDFFIVVAADSVAKAKQISRSHQTLMGTYITSLQTEDFDEFHILGYSGENDLHLNTALKANDKIGKIVVYVNPNDVGNSQLAFHYEQMYSQHSNVKLLPWTDFWNTIS